MGQMIDGKWVLEDRKYSDKGEFLRKETQFRYHITAEENFPFPAVAGRYHLYVSWACPWAHRTLILRKLKKLEDVISLSVVDYYMSQEGWEFTNNPGCIPDLIEKETRYMREVYARSDSTYTGRCSVPVLWDKERQTIVNNESKEIMRMFDTQFDALGDASESFYPEDLSEKIDQTIDAIYQPINNGVYRSGFARSQEAYETAVNELFQALDHWEDVLSKQRYLCGEQITEADWCMFTTLIRFDMVYYTHFKCNQRHLYEYPNLWNYLKELYQIPGVAETCNFEHIKNHYYQSHETINPYRVVPIGPTLQFDTPYHR